MLLQLILRGPTLGPRPVHSPTQALHSLSNRSEGREIYNIDSYYDKNVLFHPLYILNSTTSIAHCEWKGERKLEKRSNVCRGTLKYCFSGDYKALVAVHRIIAVF